MVIYHTKLNNLLNTTVNICLSGCLNGGDIVFAIDASGSVREPNFRTMLDFVIKVVERLDIDNGANNGDRGSRVGLLVFADDADVIFYLNSYTTRTEILNGISVKYTKGTTNIAKAIRWVVHVLQ